jgi:hypothetical protein
MSDVLGWKPKPILEEIAEKKRPIHPLLERAFAETGRRNKTSKKEGSFHLLGSAIYSNVMLSIIHFLCTVSEPVSEPLLRNSELFCPNAVPKSTLKLAIINAEESTAMLERNIQQVPL